MRSLLSGALIAVSATVLAAQTATSPFGAGQQTITMNGCITAGPTAAAPFMLSDAMPLAPTTVPQTSTMITPSAVGTTGTMSGSAGATTPTTGVAGTAGVTTPAPGVTATIGAAAPPAVGGPAMPPTTYQLSGTSVSSYVGQSVQVTGTLVPSPNVAAAAGTQSSGVTRRTGGTAVAGATTNRQALPQFQVTRVEPLGYQCPQ
jgi:hypothetical protein